ncbi:MAG TPA: polysaccharide biosynthesis tyrosine autokinase [Candidatus Acidoferrum sp.]|nr:polysaccharide biosynthesis tyrosine autokinase [Candidatus Acidoferrum sp.]
MRSSEYSGENQGGLSRLGDHAVSFRHVMDPEIDSPFNWEQVVRVLRKNSRFVVLFVVLMTAVVATAAFSMKDVYQPVARLEFDPLNSGIKTVQEIEENRVIDHQEYVETQVQKLRSDALAIGVIRVLHLDRNPEFVSKSDLAKFGGLAATRQTNPHAVNDGDFLQEQYDLADRTPLQSIAQEVFQKRLTVNPIRNSRLIEVSFASHDPGMAQLITNTLVTQFIEQNFRHRYTSTMQASEWLSAQLNDLRQAVQEANQAVTDYQKHYGLVESDERDVPLGQLMNEVNHHLSEAQANRIETEAYVQMIDLGQAESIPAVRDDSVYQNLMTQFAEVRAQLAQARTIYGDENSNVKKLENESSELAAQVEAEKSRMVGRIRTSFAAAQDREEMMLAERERLKTQMGDASSHMVAYRMLRNEATAKAELYNMLQARLKEAGIFAGLRSSTISVVDLAARLPRPTGPHRQLIISAGVILSGVFAVILAFVRESFENTLRTPDDIRSWTGLSSLGMLPTIPRFGENGNHGFLQAARGRLVGWEAPQNGSSSEILLTKSHTAESEAIRELRTSLLFSKPGVSRRVILVTSPSAREGKSTVAFNLAEALSQRGKTCLIEGDLRRSTFANTLGSAAKTGLSQVLSGAVSLDAALVNAPGNTELCVLPCGPLVANPESLIDSGHMKALVITIRDKFDYVVLDSAPVIDFSDSRILSTYADGVILVGRYGLTTRRAITRCAQILDEVGAPVIGVILNDIDLESPDYHYYNYGFSRRMRRLDPYQTNVYEESPPPPEPEAPVKKKSAHV